MNLKKLMSKNHQRLGLLKEELISERIRMIIKEELGIALEVENEVEKLKTAILDDLKKQKNSDDGIYKNDNMVYSCFGVTIPIKYEICDYPSLIVFNNTKKSEMYGNFSSNDWNISFFLYTINKNFNKNANVDEVVQHELHHLYDYIRSNKKSLLDKKYGDAYQRAKVIMDMFSGSEEGIYYFDKDTDRVLYEAAYALYCSFDFEIRGLANSLDAYLKNNGYRNFNDVYESDLYKGLQDIKHTIPLIEALSEVIPTYFGVDVVTYEKMLNKGLRGTQRALGRVITKYRRHQIENNDLESGDWYGPIAERLNKDLR